ncbi:MAG: KH domain-containing protein, partial [Clostridia bacterium]|nr:KH domain-containing protein [Clostridia bacterium]
RRDDRRQQEKREKPEPAKKAPAAEPAAETEPEARETAPAAEPAPEKVINYTLEEAEGNPAAEFVKGLIERMGATGTVLAARDEDCLRLRIDSEMMGMLIGHRGETLDAMQYLTGLVINRNRKTEGYTRVTLNTEEYREKREETLKRLAKKVAAQVRATGRPRALEPMNPYERRVLHSTLQNNPDVTTHSEGEEPNRRVVVTPRRRGKTYSHGSRRPSPRPAAERREEAPVSESATEE